MRRYVFSELLSIDRLLAPETLALLAGRIQLYVAITPLVRRRAVEIVDACRGAGVAVGVWPMIDDDRGRWASAWTGGAFAEYTRELLVELHAADRRPDEVLIDLEPPLALTRALLAKGRPDPRRPPPRAGARALRALVGELDRAGLAVTAAVHPWAVCGAGARGWQRAMGTPVDGLPFRRVFAMAYTSLIEGYSRGLFRRRDAEAMLAAWSAGTCAHLGAAAGIALGAVGVGALGDERCYRHPAELSRDVAIARAAGAEQLALFGLGGVLDRPPAAAWLDALCDDGPVTTPPLRTARARALLGTAATAGRLLDVLLPGAR